VFSETLDCRLPEMLTEPVARRALEIVQGFVDFCLMHGTDARFQFSVSVSEQLEREQVRIHGVQSSQKFSAGMFVAPSDRITSRHRSFTRTS
jgi:hypothetical protein